MSDLSYEDAVIKKIKEKYGITGNENKEITLSMPDYVYAICSRLANYTQQSVDQYLESAFIEGVTHATERDIQILKNLQDFLITGKGEPWFQQWHEEQMKDPEYHQCYEEAKKELEDLM